MTRPDLLLERLERAVASMDAVAREVFLAHRLDGWSYAQIAARTGLSVAEVERHFAAAILHLDQALKAMEREEGG